MCDLTSLLLYEFSSLSKSLQALPTIEAPTMNPEERSSKGPIHRMSMPVGAIGPNPALAHGGVGSRMSMTGFGSGSLTERERNKGKARVNLAIANLHLMAGLVQDAFREYTEGAIAAKTNSDYLWHGKALEGIGVSLVMMAFLGLEFQIPTVVFPPTSSLAEKPKSGGTTSVATTTTPAALFSMVPELLNTILALYSRSGTFNSEHAPAVVQSETIIRFCKLLVITQQCHGLNNHALSHIVLGTPLPPDLGKPQVKGIAKADIASIVMKAYPMNLQYLTVVDAASILGGMAAVLDKIGFKRKKAMVTRELLKLLVPSLIQARVVGAAESGMHPSASNIDEFRPLSRGGPGRPGSPQPEGPIALDGDDADIVRTSRLLDDLCSAYGITSDTLSAAVDTSTEDEKNTVLRKSLADANHYRRFGWLSLKVGVLRTCILLSEAIPDYEAVLHYTTQLLEIAGTELSKGEQGKLAESFTRTVGLARKSGMDADMGGVADYWDDYLLRDVELVESQIWKPPISHAAAELSAVTDAEKNPFIYNPFASKHTTATSLAATTVKTLLVQSEPTDFLITLQNPFDFEIQIDSVSIDATGVDIETMPASLVIGPYRQHTYIITGTPQSTGTMKILGARIKVYGCRERFFAIIPDIRNATIEGEDKVKKIGLEAMVLNHPRPKSHISANSNNAVRTSQVPQLKIGPDLKQLSINVIPAQPKLTITHTSLPQNAVMILEGERQVFTVHVKNESDSVPVDFVTVSFTDSTTEPVTNAISQKQGLPAEVYELEVILYKKKAFEWIRPEGYIKILPGEEGVFKVQVLGKPGLTSGKVVIDYGFIDRDKQRESDDTENSGRWYTRRAEASVTVTVNASVELVRMDFLPWSGVASSLLALQPGPKLQNGDILSPEVLAASSVISTTQSKDEQIKELFSRLSRLKNPSTYALVLIDVRNSWPHPLRISMSYNPLEEDLEVEEDDMKYMATDTIPAGHSTRLILPLKRIYVASPTAPIPSLSKTQRQYVVSLTKVSPEMERVTREGFWYKEAVLARISGNWEEVGTGRGGMVECRNFRMGGSRGVDVVRVEDVDVAVLLEADSSDGEVTSLGKGRWSLKTDEFFKVKVIVRNRGEKKVRLISRLLPCLRFMGGGSGINGLEMTRRAGYNGTLQKSLGWVRGGEERVVEMGMVIIASGEYEILGCVEEVKGDNYDEEEAEGELQPREPLEVEQQLLEDMIRGEKKVWYAREACNIVVSD
ncbi:hypothetical protein ABW19_dt0200042 [Dactylella cylindrospora]|nr:hypothetical protein ABW19_dt0200042 [Dactylella cylindrospora]